MRILVIGADGALGQDLMDAFRAAGHEPEGSTRSELDVTDPKAVHGTILGGSYDAVVNATAYNNVDGAETPEGREVAFAVNAAAPGAMARACRDAGIPFVHYSTDYVFAGDKPEGYTENDEPDPINAYGESKAAGERAVLDSGADAFVCRTSKLFGRPGAAEGSKPSFVSIMLKLAKEKPELVIVDEEVGMPTFTKDIASATVRLLDEGSAPGIYHFVNEGPGVTWFGFAEEIFGIAGVATPRKPVSSEMFPKPAKRPKFGALKNTKFPPFRSRADALAEFLGTVRT